MKSPPFGGWVTLLERSEVCAITGLFQGRLSSNVHNHGIMPQLSKKQLSRMHQTLFAFNKMQCQPSFQYLQVNTDLSLTFYMCNWKNIKHGFDSHYSQIQVGQCNASQMESNAKHA